MQIPEFSSIININTIKTKFYKPEYIVNKDLERFKPLYEKLIKEGKIELIPEFIKIVNQGKFKDETNILYNENKEDGKYHIKVDYDSEISKRMECIKLMIEKPKIYKAISEDKSTIFHGTNARALDSILKNGIQSMSEIKKNGLELTTGEEFSRLDDKSRNFISLTQDYKTAKNYSELPNSNDNKDDINDFGIIICIAQDYLKKLNISYTISDCDEIPIQGIVPIDAIKSIIAPEDKIQYLETKLQGTNIKVLSDDIKKEKAINQEDIKDLAKTRTSSSIKETFNKLKEKVKSKIKENKIKTKNTNDRYER